MIRLVFLKDCIGCRQRIDWKGGKSRCGEGNVRDFCSGLGKNKNNNQYLQNIFFVLVNIINILREMLVVWIKVAYSQGKLDGFQSYLESKINSI